LAPKRHRANKHTAVVIATEYLKNGNNRAKAMQALGYKPSYISGHSYKLFARKDVKEAIDKLQIQVQITAGITVESICNELDDLKHQAEKKQDFSTAVRCVELKGKTAGVFKDVSEVSDITIAKEIDETKKRELIRLANLSLTQKTA
jgi:hypothetical protein